MKNKTLIALFLCLMFFKVGCRTDLLKQDLEKANKSAGDINLKNWSSVPRLEDFACFSKYECRPDNGCLFDSDENKKLLNENYQWKQILPHNAKLRVERDGFLTYFSWKGNLLKERFEYEHPPFKKGQAWVVRLNVQDEDFGNVRNKTNFFSDFLTNLPCPFKHYDYAKNNSLNEFTELVSKNCGLTKNKIESLKLYTAKQTTEYFVTNRRNSFSVGSMCPEEIKSDIKYFILYRYNNGEQKTTKVSLSSALIEDSFNLQPYSSKTNFTTTTNPFDYYTKISDCPYLIGATDITIDSGRYVCGKTNEETWINRVCVPTNLFSFIPGIDSQKTTKNTKANCFDDTQANYDGDGDGWFDNRTHIYDVGGNVLPITNNMLLHGTFIGDCVNTDHNLDYHTDLCNWYNIGHIKGGIQCYWKEYQTDSDCYFDEMFLNKHYPELFLKRFFEESKKYNNRAGSFDRIGRPQSWVQKVNNGFLQVFKYGGIGPGAIMLSQKYTEEAFYIGWPFWEIYSYTLDHAYGELGYPIKQAEQFDTYTEQLFENGWIRKYQNEQCWLVNINKKMPKQICLKCSVANDCKNENDICLNGYCVNEAKIKNNTKICTDKWMCRQDETCDETTKLCIKDVIIKKSTTSP